MRNRRRREPVAPRALGLAAVPTFLTRDYEVRSERSTVSTTGGLGVFHIDPTTQDDRVVNTITQLCDGRIDVRTGDGGRELRVRGLADQSRAWRPF